MGPVSLRRALSSVLQALLFTALLFLLGQCSDKSVDREANISGEQTSDESVDPEPDVTDGSTSDESTDPEQDISRQLTMVEAELVESDNEFGLRLFKTLSSGEPDSNLFISPLSVAMALGMALNGANGATREAIESTLGFTGMSLAEINKSYQSLSGLLMKLDPKVTFQIANSIWYRESFAVEQEFLDINRTYFDAEVTAMNFSAPDATHVINSWVSNKTNGKIEKIVGRISGDVMMYLIDAVYFKGTWTYRFDPESTEDGLFYCADGSTVLCRLMNLNTELDFFSNTLCKGVNLPYGDERFSMTILMPRGNTAINSLVADLTKETWDEWLAGSTEQEVSVYLPRFRVEYEKKLNDVLADLGMGIAFTGAADFTKINRGGGLWIDEVKQKTFVEVNEEGTEAAAVTSVSMIRGMPPILRCDHPFLYVIRERQSGTILFIGKMMDIPAEG